jgi:FixJ family two-component response regulator
LDAPEASLILVVEDDDDVRNSIRMLLEAEGYRVREFASAEVFLAATDGREADCLLLDFQMSGLSGLDLLEALRAQGVTVPAIIITADTNPPKERCARAGVLAVLRKPHAVADMLGWIEKACAAG